MKPFALLAFVQAVTVSAQDQKIDSYVCLVCPCPDGSEGPEQCGKSVLVQSKYNYPSDSGEINIKYDNYACGRPGDLGPSGYVSGLASSSRAPAPPLAPSGFTRAALL